MPHRQWIQKAMQFIRHDLWHPEAGSESRLHAFGIEVLRVTHLVLTGVRKDNCALHASALTFSSLMAMVPFLFILFAISSAIGLDTASTKLLEWAKEMPDILPFVEALIRVVNQVDLLAGGGISGLICIFFVFKLLNGIEESFNQIWGVHTSRSLTDKLRNYLAILLVVPVLLVLATATTPTLIGALDTLTWMGPATSLLIKISPVAILFLAFLIIFLFIPNTRVSIRAAFTGAVISALLAALLQTLIIKAGIGVTRISMIYGTFAYIPIFLFWMQMSWNILLFGAELAFAIQNRGTYQEEQQALKASMTAKLWVAFAVMKEAVRVFQSTESSVNVTNFARKHNIPIRLANEVVKVLANAKLLGNIATDGLECYALLQAPEQVSAKQVYDLVLADGASPKELGLAPSELPDAMLRAVNEGLDQSLNAISLQAFKPDIN